MGTTTIDHRRAARLRKVRPVAFVAQSAVESGPSLRTVTANVSRSGMLLVTRRDQFPPAGAGVLLMPFEIAAGAPDSSAAIRGRIVYTRFSPRAQLRFAGLKFEQDLSERSAQMLGIDGAPDAVTDAIATLDELENYGGAPTTPQPTFGIRAMSAIDASARENIEVSPATEARAALDAARRELYREVGAFMADWGEARIRQALGAKYALARAKGIEGLRGMKAEWHKIRQGLPVLAEVELSRAETLPIGADENPYYNAKLDQPPARMMQAIRDLAGEIGQLVIQHGFEDAGTGGDWAPIAQERGRVSFNGPLAVSERVRELLLRAADLHEKVRESLRATAEMQASDARADVLRMWDRA